MSKRLEEETLQMRKQVLAERLSPLGKAQREDRVTDVLVSRSDQARAMKRHSESRISLVPEHQVQNKLIIRPQSAN